MVDYTVAPSMTARNCLLKRTQRDGKEFDDENRRGRVSKRNEIFIDNNFAKKSRLKSWKDSSKIEIKRKKSTFPFFLSIFLIFSVCQRRRERRKKKKKIETEIFLRNATRAKLKRKDPFIISLESPNRSRTREKKERKKEREEAKEKRG